MGRGGPGINLPGYQGTTVHIFIKRKCVCYTLHPECPPSLCVEGLVCSLLAVCQVGPNGKTLEGL